MLNITLSNRFEILLENLLKELEKPSKSVFSAERIIIPNSAVKRKLSLAIADRFGICANYEFPFLAEWLWQEIGQFIPVDDVSPFAPQVLCWRILCILNDAAFVEAHPRLASYLARCDEVMRYELSRHIASTMEQYVTYRPDWLAAWSDDKEIQNEAFQTDEGWQAALWRRIEAEIGETSPSSTDVFFKVFEEHGEKLAETLPEKICVFCPSAIAPQYIQILSHLSQWIDIRMFVLNPCREYWFEVVDAKRLSYLEKRGKSGYHESGNRLLASWGKQSQAFLDLLFDRTAFGNTEESIFLSNAEEDKPPSLLAQLQDAILDLTELKPHSISPADDDRSLEIHVCHSLTREIEVLHDQLLMAFSESNLLKPEDILVVTPDLEQAAPLIEAVFSNAPSHCSIPYVITGRSSSKVNLLARALLDLLNVVTSRFSANDIFNLLLQPVIANRFGLRNKLDEAHQWLSQSGICWGLDGEHKQEFDLPAMDGHSFHDGFHRLFLGYALPLEAHYPFDGYLPVGNPEGKSAESLGSLWNFVQQLRKLRTRLSRPQSAHDWMQALLGILDNFTLAREDQIDDDLELRDQIRELYRNMHQGCDIHPLPLSVVRHALTRMIDGSVRGGVPFGAVTFSSMSSLRYLPYKRVCVIGLNSGVFPDSGKPLEFDLLSMLPRRGDRQRRDDDRNLFLDLLLAARESFYLSYTGRSVRDNSVRPPSVLISELLDYLVPVIAMNKSPDAVRAVRNRLVLEHPLQPFSLQYFNGSGDPRLQSCNEEFCQALQEKHDHARDYVLVHPGDLSDDEAEDESVEVETVFFRDSLSRPDEVWREVSLSQLIRFFNNPSRFLLQQRMGMAFIDERDELLEHEPFLPDQRACVALAKRILPLYLEGRSSDQILEYARAGNEYPAGKLGRVLLEAELKEIARFAQAASKDIAAPTLGPFTTGFEFSFDKENWTLTGSLHELREQGLVRYRYGNISPRDYLAGWIEHLFLNASSPFDVEKQTIGYFRNSKYRMKPYGNAKNGLRDLVDLYRMGLEKPLHFFPASAWEYVTNNAAMKKAHDKWKNKRKDGWGESSDPFYRLALRGQEKPLDDSFAACAKIIMEPLLSHMEEEKP